MPCLRALMISVRGTYLNVSRHSELLSVNVALGRPTRVRAQRGLLERAIGNLVDNALKFSDEPDGVEITVDGPVIEVADRGPGIDDADRGKVFGRFYRADNVRSRPGSGLGLSIVDQIAEGHGAPLPCVPAPAAAPSPASRPRTLTS